MAKIELEKLRDEHLVSQAVQGKVKKQVQHDVRETIEHSFNDFIAEVYTTRSGQKKDPQTGKLIPSFDISLKKACELYFGCSDVEMLNSIGIFTQSDNLETVAEKTGFSGALTKSSLEQLLIDHTSFNTNTSQDFPANFRFLIPELILNAVRVAYEHAAMYPSWTALTVNISQRKITMPFIQTGDAVPSRVNEGAKIPFGTVKYGQKDASVYKIGTGFEVTDELMYATTIEMMTQFLGEVGNEMSIGTDVEALSVLVNGEQSSNAESAPVVGIESTSAGFQPIDIDRIIEQMTGLKKTPTRLIMRRNDAYVDLNESKPQRPRLKIADYANLPHNSHVLPANQLMFLAANACLAQLKYRSLMVERERDVSTQKERLYVSDHIGFAILRRDGRVLLDKSVAFASVGFPAYMDIDTRINKAFAK